MKRDLQQLFEALLDLTGVLNRPQPDVELLALAGVHLDRALFPILVRVGRRGPIAIGELADLCDRDYSTVSRQVAKLETLGVLARNADPNDGRVTRVAITKAGAATLSALDLAREKRMTALLAHWDKAEISQLSRLLRKLADDALKSTRNK